jgi:hypothetical protein
MDLFAYTIIIHKFYTVIIEGYCMEVAKRDIVLLSLHKILDDKRRFLRLKTNDIQKSSQDNEFLLEVAQDYSKYHTYIKQQKIEQTEALQLLSDYISKTTNTLQQTEEVLAQSRKQQEHISHYIHRMRQEIDAMIE